MWQCYIVDFPHRAPTALLSLSLTSSGSLSSSLSRRPLAVGGTTVTFYRCKPFVCLPARYSYNPRVRYLYSIARPHTRSHRTRTRVLWSVDAADRVAGDAGYNPRRTRPSSFLCSFLSLLGRSSSRVASGSRESMNLGVWPLEALTREDADAF